MTFQERNTVTTESAPVSVIIVNWNGAGTLARCLAALTQQTLRDFELIVVDNASTDGSTLDLEKKFPALHLQVERLPRNVGFAAASNMGAKHARNKWLAFLNPDAFASPDWLENLLDATISHPEFSFFASRMIQAEDHSKLDGAGDMYHISGLAWRHYYNKPANQFGDAMEEVFSACAAAALYAKDAFWRVNGFDEDFFSYNEDVDLGFRLRLLGLRCLYVPASVVYHVGSATLGKKSDFAIYHGQRNLVWVYWKDMPARLFWTYLPIHVLINILYIIYYSFQGRSGAIWRAKIDALRGLRLMLRKRRDVQQTRCVAVKELRHAMDGNWLSPHPHWR